MLNDVKFRFLSLPKSATEGLEHEPKKSDFNIIKELGMGSFGTVYLVSHKKTKAQYALKAIDKTVEENLEEKANFNREVEIMYKLNHPNIVKLYGHFEDDKYCYFIMQYIPNKSLFELVPLPGQKPNTKLIASVMKDLISAVYYLHHMKPVIIYRDIKPENILLDKNNKAYLTDFGWSNYMPNFCRRTTVCGTPLYLPPEMIEKSGHDETADIWCIGVLLFELISGQTPFKGDDIDTVAYNIRKLNITWPPYMDPDAKDLISKILKLHGKDRLPIEQILSHKFFSKYFPNALKELIKPESQKITTFVVSIDDPKDYGKQNRTNSNSTIENNEAQSKINTNISDNNKNNYRNSNYSRINNDNNSNVNNKMSVPIRSTYVPKANIDLYKRNVKDNKKSNDNKITINTSFNRNNITYDTKSYNQNKLRNTYSTYSTNANNYKNVNKAISPSNNYNKNYRNTNNNLNNNTLNNNNRINTSSYSTINNNTSSKNNRINTSRYSTINNNNITSNNNRINPSRYSTITNNTSSNNNRINTSRYSTINNNNTSSNNNRINTSSYSTINNNNISSINSRINPSRYSTINNNSNVHHRINSYLIKKDNNNNSVQNNDFKNNNYRRSYISKH